MYLSSPFWRPAGATATGFVILTMLLLSVHGAPHLQATQALSSSSARSSNPTEVFGMCTVVAKAPPAVRCGLNPSDDTFVDDFFPDKPFAMAVGNPAVAGPILIVQDTTQYHVDYGNLSLNYAYLKFDLMRLLPQELLLSHAEPRNATLWLFVRWVSPFYNASMRVYRALSNDWKEETLTWNTKPELDNATYAESSVRADGAWVRWDVSEQVRAALREGSAVSLAVIASETSWRNVVWFDSKDQRQQDDVSTRPELDLDFVAPVLTVQTSYPNLPITIGNRTFQTDLKGAFRAFLAWGRYEITVPETIPKGEGARVAFVGWSDNISEPRRVITIGNNMTLQANYEMQYYLDVNSSYGSANGSGWYPQNQEALTSVSPTTVMAEGLSGILGVRRVFDHWSGDCTGTQPECSIIMEGPKKLGAVWRDDYTVTMLGLVVLIVAAATLVLLRKRAHLRRS